MTREWTSCMPESLTRDSAVTDAGYRLWALLDSLTRTGDAPMPSRADLAHDLGRSVDTVDRAIRNLVKAGWLVVTKEVGYASQYALVATR